MSDNDDATDQVSFEFQVNEAGLKGSLRSRLITAFDRLVGHRLDLWGVGMERRLRLERERIKVEEELIRAEGEAAKAKLLAAHEVGDQVLDRFLANESRKQANKCAVLREAIIDLKALPPPEEAPDNTTPMSDDWLNFFGSYAEKASSEHMRKLWGQILAGEIRRVGSFSINTLRVAAEIDLEIAQEFQSVVRTRTTYGYIPEPPNVQGHLLDRLTLLEEVGLLQEVNGHIGIDLRTNDDNIGFCVHKTQCIRFKLNKASVGRMKYFKTYCPRLPIIKITRAGREICSIVPEEADDVFLRAAAEAIADHCETVELPLRNPQAATPCTMPR
jgi:hypothetical protein